MNVFVQSLAAPLTIVLIWSVSAPCHGAETLRAGAAKVDISPAQFPVLRNGGFLEASDDRLADPIHARALALESGSNRVALVVVDSCMIPRAICDEVKAAAAHTLGLRQDRILISATHTHSAPSVMNYCLGTRADPHYTKYLPGRIVEALAQAVSRLQPARAGWTRVDAGAFTHCRRWILRSDRMRTDPFGEATVRANMHPGHEHPDFIGPSGPKDPWLSLLSVQTLEGKPLALLANYSMHYFGGHPGISADYCGRFSEGLAARLAPDNPEFVAMLSQGTSGDLMWMDYGRPRASWNVDDYTGQLLDLAEAGIQEIEHRAGLELDMTERRMVLSRRLPDDARLGWARNILAEMGDHRPRNQQEVYAEQAIYIHENPTEEIVVQAIRLGDLGITAMPNEVYGITGLKIKERSPLALTFNIELANGAAGYIPPPEQHALGGYTTWPARTAGLETNAEPKIAETALALLEDVSGRPRRRAREPATEYSNFVLRTMPVAYWRLGEFEGGRAEDGSGHHHHARFAGRVAYHLPGVESPAMGAPYQSHAAHLAGGHVAADVPGLGASFTIELWLWNGLDPKTREVTATICARGPWQLVITGRADAFPGRLQIGSLRGRAHLTTRHWHHIALVRDGDRMRVYLNGDPQPELEGTVPRIKDGDGDDTILLGDARDHSSPLEGKLDEVAIYDRILTLEEVRSHYQASGMSGANFWRK